MSGCGTDTPSRSPSDEADILLVRKAIADEERLLAFGTAVSRRFRVTRSPLASALAGQALHVSRLRASLTDLDPPVSANHATVPVRPDDALKQVVRLTADVKDARLAGCQTATAGLLAELLGSVAASHAVTVSALSPDAVGGPPPAAAPVRTVAPLQRCLAGEHAAVYGYGLLAGVLSAGVSQTPVADAARSSYQVHRSRRDVLVELIRAAAEPPVASAAAYDLPFPVTGSQTAHRLARLLEARCAAVYAQSVGALQRGDRRFVSAALVDCAVRGAGWGAPPVPFPGLPVG